MALNDAFRAKVGDWAQKLTPDGLMGVARVAIQDLASAVDEDTNVDTGFLVGSWQPSIGAPSNDTGAIGTNTASLVSLILTDIKLGDVFFYSNNAEYAMRIEYGFVGEDSLGRSYNQAGYHFVGRNVVRWQAFVNGAATKLGYQ